MNDKAIVSAGDKSLAVNNPAQSFAGLAVSQTQQLAGFTAENQFRIRFPREGKIHLGVKKKTSSGSEYPTATDYFVLPENLLNDIQFREALVEIGQEPDTPRALPIWLPSNNICDNIQSSYDRYSNTKGLICRSLDGVTRKCLNEKTGEIEDGPCLNAKCPFYERGECVVIHRLRVMLPDAQGVGVWQIDTKSPNSWGNICSDLTNILGYTGKRLAGLDLTLVLEPTQKQISYTDKQSGAVKQTLKDVYLLRIKPGVRLRDLKDAAVKAAERVDWDMADVAEVDTTYDEITMEHAPESDDFEVGEELTIEGKRAELVQHCRNLESVCFANTPVKMSTFRKGFKSPGFSDVEELSDTDLERYYERLKQNADFMAKQNNAPVDIPPVPEDEPVDADFSLEPPGEPEIGCADCGKAIKATTWGGVQRSVSEIVDLTTAKHGSPLCSHCLAKRDSAAKR